VLYECLTGERVFPRDSRLAEAWAHLEEEPPRPSRKRPELPDRGPLPRSRRSAMRPAARWSPPPRPRSACGGRRA
jgi:serine/threonine-protein kinase